MMYKHTTIPVTIMSALDQLLEILPTLTPEELLVVRQRISVLDNLAGVQRENISGDWLLFGVLSQIQDMGLGETIPDNFKILNRRQFYGYMPKSEKVRLTLEKNIKNLSQLDKAALGKLLARCLAAKVASFRTVSLNALLQHVDLSLPALDEAFPGYLESGLVKVILRHKVFKYHEVSS